jgi:hypothetical protein
MQLPVLLRSESTGGELKGEVWCNYGGPERIHAQAVDRDCKEHLSQYSVPTLIVERGKGLFARFLYSYAVDSQLTMNDIQLHDSSGK